MTEQLDRQLARWQAAEIISKEQRAAIGAFEQAHGPHNPESRDPEAFVLFRGLSDVFVTLGLVFTLMSSFALSLDSVLERVVPAALAGICLFLTRFYAQKRRMVLPALALTLLYCFFVLATLFALGLEEDALYNPQRYDLSPWSGFVALTWAGLGLVVLHAAVTRLAFCVVPLTLASFVTLGVTVNGLLLWAGATDGLAWLNNGYFLIIGLGVLGVGLWHDLRDPERRGQGGRVGFWCHIMAAPALVQALVFGSTGIFDSLGAMVLALGLLGGAFLFSLVLDRKSFLTSALIAFVSILSATLDKTGIFNTGPLAETGSGLAVFIVGLMGVVVGTWWTQIRQAVMRALPDFSFKERLPPYGDF